MSHNAVEEIRERNDIIDLISGYVNLKQRGRDFLGLCPFHKESTPSFSVSPDKQLYYCFGCGAGGNVYTFVMAMENYEFKDALKYLAERVDYTFPLENVVPKEQSKNLFYEINKSAARFFYNNLQESTKAKSYLAQRGISERISRKFGLGYSKDKWAELHKFLIKQGYKNRDLLSLGLTVENKTGGYYDKFRDRLMFPIFDIRGNIVAFGGRSLGEQMPKYMNSPESSLYSKSEHLYALNFARKSKALTIILVEGYMDAIALHQAGITNSAGVLGTAFNANHAKSLRSFGEVILVFDGDEAGVQASFRAIKVLSDKNLKILTLKNAKDPDEYLQKFSKEDFLEEVAGAKFYIDFQIEYAKKDLDLDKAQDKIEFTKRASEFISDINDAVIKETYINQVSKFVGLPPSAIKSQMENVGIAAKNLNYNKPGETKALENAKKNIINILAKNSSLCQNVRPFLSPEEMGEGLYKEVLTLIYRLEKEVEINLHQILSNFPDKNDQELLGSIFGAEPDLTEEYLIKAVPDEVKLIKKSYLEEKIRLEQEIIKQKEELGESTKENYEKWQELENLKKGVKVLIIEI